MEMYDPPHPGELIREDCLVPLKLSVTEAAEGLGVARKTLSAILNSHAGISPEMAMRLELAGWSTAETWLQMQLQWDLWTAKQRKPTLKVTRFPEPVSA